MSYYTYLNYNTTIFSLKESKILKETIYYFINIKIPFYDIIHKKE